MNIKVVIAILSILLIYGCSNHSVSHTKEEDKVAKEMLQGIWVDDDTELPLIKVKGDSIYYADGNNIPFAFYIIDDTIYICGKDTVQYKIDKHTEDTFWFHSLSDVVIKTHKAESEETDWQIDNNPIETTTENKVIKKDSIVFYNNIRYRGYVYINPSKLKVYRSTYSENGYKIENVYYDNIIHICIYNKSELLYGKDFYKSDFSNLFPKEFLDQAILADMDFIGVNREGYHYQAILRMPDSAIFGCVHIVIGFDRALKMYIKK